MGWKYYPNNFVFRNDKNDGTASSFLMIYDAGLFGGGEDTNKQVTIFFGAADYNADGDTFDYYKLSGPYNYSREVKSWPRSTSYSTPLFRATFTPGSIGISFIWHPSINSGDKLSSVNDFDKLKDGNIRVIPVFKSVWYNARFYKDGALFYTQSFKPGLSYTAPAVTSKSGYTVDWRSSSPISKTIASLATYSLPIIQNINFYQTETPITYSISYNNLLGASHTNPHTYNIETNTINLSNPSNRAGYAFVGWYTASSGGMRVYSIAKGTIGNITLYARWVEDKTNTIYNITRSFTGNGLSVTGHTNYTSRSYEQTRTVTVTRLDGYAFSNTYITRESGAGNDAPTMSFTTSGNVRTCTITIPAYSYGSILFYASSTIVTYSITYVLNGGTGDHNNLTEYNVETKVNLIQGGLFKTGYTFDGWYTNSNFTGSPVTSFGPGEINNKTFYAKWSPITYNITYLTGGTAAYPVTNSNHGNPTTYNIESATITFVQGALARPGWTFDRFTPSSIASGSYGARNISVSWIADNYSITLNANGGSGGSINNNSYSSSQNDGSNITRTLTKPTRLGWTFSSWSVTRTGTYGGPAPYMSGDTLNIPSGSYGGITVIANWTGNTNNSISFSGASISSQNWTTSASAQTKNFTIPARTGYRISSVTITSQSSGTNSTLSGTGYERTINIPAQAYGAISITITWVANTYTLKFNSEGGSTVADKQVTYDAVVGALSTPARPGYNFDGWFTASSGGSQITSNSINLTSEHGANVQLYAQWTARTLTVNYAANGGSGSMTPSYGSYGGEIAIKSNSFSRPGYTFAGWLNSDTSATEKNIVENQTYDVADLSSTITGDVTAATITLTAQWTINKYNITFVSNGGTSVATINQDYNSSVTKPADPTKNGFTFGGWYTDSGLTTAQTWPFNMPIDGKTLYAKWNSINYKIFIDENGGQAVSDLDYNSSTSPQSKTLPAMIRTGTGKKYSFSRWVITTNSQGADSSIAGTLNIPELAYGDITIKAIWTVAERRVAVGANIFATDKIKVGETSIKKVIVTDADGNPTTVFENEETEE